ncbi:serpin family protein [Streptomyces sp. NPDC001514]
MGRGVALVGHARAVRGLGERWIRELGDGGGGDGGDFVCSPAGLWLALGAVAAGARGETAEELRGLLGVAGEQAAEAVTGVARELAVSDALGVATRVWSRVPVYRAYREALPDIGFGHLGKDGQDEIDAWVKEATGGQIEKLPVRIQQDTLLALVNALALKARWQTPFESRITRDAPFTDATGAVHEVPTMHRQLRPGDAWTAGTATVVELRCEADAARVRFVLGAPGAGAADVLPAAWAPREACRPVDAEVVSLALPRLTLRTTVDVTPQLPALGIHRATSPAADFSGLSPEPLAISQVVQEAVIKVAELGVEAAAVTVIPLRAGSAYRPQRAVRIAYDRPFGIVVLDGTGEVPLFAAWQATAPAGEPTPPGTPGYEGLLPPPFPPVPHPPVPPPPGPPRGVSPAPGPGGIRRTPAPPPSAPPSR